MHLLGRQEWNWIEAQNAGPTPLSEIDVKAHLTSGNYRWYEKGAYEQWFEIEASPQGWARRPFSQDWTRNERWDSSAGKPRQCNPWRLKKSESTPPLWLQTFCRSQSKHRDGKEHFARPHWKCWPNQLHDLITLVSRFYWKQWCSVRDCFFFQDLDSVALLQIWHSHPLHRIGTLS